jgi:hypothetical protein
MPKVIELNVSQSTVGNACRRTLTLTGPETQRREFFFEFSENYPPGELVELDSFVFGVIFLAMQERAALRVRGPISRSAMMNLVEFQAIWSRWKPHDYQPVEIIPDSVVDRFSREAPLKAIAAFSGGADSVFTTLTHAGPAKSAPKWPLTDLLLVHGFDLAVDDFDALERLQKGSRPFVDSLGLNFRSVRTNLRRDSGQDWEDSFAAQLAACLHQYAPEFRYALIGSSMAYGSLFLPWGSSPMTDHLLSSDRMSIVLDGCRFSRTEKIARISTSPLAIEGLNVCWEGASGSNCGHCEKCVRTRLNFLAVGTESPACFSTPLNLRDIEAMPLRIYPQFHELVSLRDYARQHSQTGEWIHALNRRILLYRFWHRWINASLARVRKSRWLPIIRRARAIFAKKS